MNKLREILLLLAVIGSLAAAWGQAAGKPVYQQNDPAAANFIKNRVAIVGEGASTDNLSGNLRIGWVDNLDYLTDGDLDNFVTFNNGLSAAIAVNPLVGVRDNKRHYAAETPAGFRILAKSNSGLLSLDVIKLYSIVFYCEGMRVGSAPCSNGNGGNVLGLGLISFATGDAAMDLVAVAPAEFDEIHLMPAGGVNADVVNSMKIQYGFVGDPYKYTLTNQGAGNPGGIEEYNTDYDHNITLQGGGGAASQNNHLIDADLDNDGPFASVLTLGNVTASVTATDKTGKTPFEAGTSVGFHYTSGDLLDLGIAPTMTLELLDAKGKTLQTEHLNTTVLGLGLIGGSVGDYVIKADQDFYAVKFTYASVSVKLGAFVAKYFYVTPEAAKAGDLQGGNAIILKCESVDYKDGGGADIVASVESDKPVKVEYVSTDTPITDIDNYTDKSWTEVTPNSAGKYDINIPSTQPTDYIYIKATDEDGHTYLILEQSPGDFIAPTCSVPNEVVCCKGCDVTVTDNKALAKIEYSTDGGSNWTTVISDFSALDDKTSYVVHLDKPTSGTSPVVYNFRVTDAAHNEETYADVVTIYLQHDWKNLPSTVMLRKDDGTFVQCTYDECVRGCLTVDYKDDTPDEELTHQEAEKEIFKKRVEALVTKDYEEILMREYDVKAAIEAINDHSVHDGADDKERPYYVVFTGDLNVGGNTSTPTIAPPNNDIGVVLDLNGYGLRVDGVPYADDGKSIQGNPRVSILLTDDGELEYTNASKVTGTPVLYRRILFSPYQKGSWQSLYLPFDCSTIPGATFGTVSSVELKDTEATLYIDFLSTGRLSAFKHYFVRANDDFELHPASATLYAYKSDEHNPIATSGYSISGSLKNTDNRATEGSTFWVLTNDGNFWYSAPGNHQRPYRWVIFDRAGSAHAPQTLSLRINGDDGEAEGIAPVLAEAPHTRPDNIYTISGMRMPSRSSLPSGIYVADGKKILVR